MKLDEDSPIPLYYQLENIIREKVEKGDYGVEEQIPSERELSELFKLSRMTVRRALNELVEEGILYRKRGQGTFVARKKIESVPELIGFNEHIKARGMKPENKVIEQRVMPCSKLIAEKLQVKEGSKVIFTNRLRLADREPLAIEKSYVPYELCPILLDEDLAEGSIYECLKQSGYKPTEATDEVEAILADEYLSEVLNIEVGQPILKRERKTYAANELIEFSFNFYRGDRYTIINKKKSL
ncbi:GntR family transcriptional regulator [Orenia metallireducens]|jgi:GntR family transcriptional regulator|uniref:Transcriptional regulator, GntR family n=1 Tax=Orenia metallireducens TaxID=1413210 RepID=A0A285GCA1_9FIRM|nr:GntR family transcriptional regulator [Orenia metallireducens]PRX32459.1 GntR family transcriptional regulator [Orenia metallireducens]SNY21212.1 transcriptional regulator, GntR family [Orenia metallireducens]